LHSIKYIEVSALTGENIQAAIGVVVSGRWNYKKMRKQLIWQFASFLDIQTLIESNTHDVTTDKTIHLRHRVDVSKRNQCCGTGGMVWDWKNKLKNEIDDMYSTRNIKILSVIGDLWNGRKEKRKWNLWNRVTRTDPKMSDYWLLCLEGKTTLYFLLIY